VKGGARFSPAVATDAVPVSLIRQLPPMFQTDRLA
jgi:hypothetical protein